MDVASQMRAQEQASPVGVQAFYDAPTGTVSYVVWERSSTHAAVIDPVLNFNAKSGRLGHEGAQAMLTFVQQHQLVVQWILETHLHADHLSAARWLQQHTGGRIAIGQAVREAQKVFKAVFNLERGFLPDGSQFDHLFAPDESFNIGGLRATALHVPGHTPADMAYQIECAANEAVLFVGDTLFMPDVGTARADFPGGDARTLYHSIQRLLALPPSTAMYVCHDYPPPNRGPRWLTSVAEQRALNIHVHTGVDEEAFVQMRHARDATLEAPALIFPSIQVNVRAGHLPPADDNGISYLRIPINALPVRAKPKSS